MVAAAHCGHLAVFMNDIVLAIHYEGLPLHPSVELPSPFVSKPRLGLLTRKLVACNTETGSTISGPGDNTVASLTAGLGCLTISEADTNLTDTGH